ncbi:MAG: hypothetical protein ACK4YP_28980 [Myxococcota bacterium]
MPVRLEQQVEEIVTSVRAFERGRAGRLAAVTLGVPAPLPPDTVAEAVRASLAAGGATNVDVSTRPTKGALRVVSVEFER